MREIVVIPTYNERENVRAMAEAVRKAVPEAGILFVDDASPDGTGDEIDAVSRADDHVMCLHRAGKEGVARAS